MFTMAFEQEEEDFEYGSVFQDDEDDEEYEEASEFADYSDEQIEQKWGNFSFEDLVFELEHVLGASKKYFFSKRKRVVDAEEMVNLTKLISERLPDEITKARDIIDEEQLILSDARKNASAVKADADSYHKRTTDSADAAAAQMIAAAKSRAEQIVESANAQAKDTIARAEEKARIMVDEHTITAQARDRGVEIVEGAKQEARSIVEGTNSNCEEYINRVMTWADGNISGVNEYVFGLLNSARDAYKIGINNIDGVKTKYKSDFDSQVASLKKAPRISKKQQNNNQ